MLKSLAKLNAFELHKLVIHRLQQREGQKTKTDLDVIREHHRFLWDDAEQPADWEQQLAKKYYSKLFREYCICDLNRYKENKIAMRWRTEPEVVAGKGQFICGSKHCPDKEELRSWEVNFTYAEQGEKKNALVKLRLCPSCSKKLNYHSTKRLVKKQKRLKSKGHPVPVGPVSPGNMKDEPKDDREDEEFAMGEQCSSHAEESSSKDAQSQWKEKANIEEKSREEEFGDYLEDLLL